MDFVAYVAKDDMQGRACHVIECGGGLAQDVITTIGQAFELRFKNYLAQRAVPLNVPSRYDELPFSIICRYVFGNCAHFLQRLLVEVA